MSFSLSSGKQAFSESGFVSIPVDWAEGDFLCFCCVGDVDSASQFQCVLNGVTIVSFSGSSAGTGHPGIGGIEGFFTESNLRVPSSGIGSLTVQLLQNDLVTPLVRPIAVHTVTFASTIDGINTKMLLNWAIGLSRSGPLYLESLPTIDGVVLPHFAPGSGYHSPYRDGSGHVGTVTLTANADTVTPGRYQISIHVDLLLFSFTGVLPPVRQLQRDDQLNGARMVVAQSTSAQYSPARQRGNMYQ